MGREGFVKAKRAGSDTEPRECGDWLEWPAVEEYRPPLEIAAHGADPQKLNSRSLYSLFFPDLVTNPGR